ncbi:MAG: glycosyltransferase family 4 protein [bacterium]|nr:glycosyltransferase family 4 protein [bacterium]
MAKKRLVHLSSVASWDYSRLWRIACSQAKEYDVEIHARAKFEFEERNGIKIYGYQGGISFGERYDRIQMFRRKMFANPPDFVQINSPEQLFLLRQLKEKYHVKTIWDSYEYYPDAARFAWYASRFPMKQIVHWMANSMIPKMARHAELILTSDPPTARYYKELGHPNCHTLINYLTTTEYQRTIPPRPDNHPELHYGGILSQSRGGALMLDAMKLLKEQYRPVKLLVTGPPPTDPAIVPWDEALATRGISDIVEHRGFVELDENYDLMAMAKLAILPTNIDRYRFNLPQKILYYLGWGVPVVSTEMPALKEVLPEGLSGVYYVKESPSEFADRIKYLLDHDDERIAAGQRGREWLLANGRWDHCEQILLERMREL